MVLRVDRRPAVELEASGRGGISKECERQLAILARVAGPCDENAVVGVGQDLGLAVEVG